MLRNIFFSRRKKSTARKELLRSTKENSEILKRIVTAKSFYPRQDFLENWAVRLKNWYKKVLRGLDAWAPACMGKGAAAPPLENRLGGLDFFLPSLTVLSLFTTTVYVCKLFLIVYNISLKLIYEHSKDPKKCSAKIPSFSPCGCLQQTKKCQIKCIMFNLCI